MPCSEPADVEDEDENTQQSDERQHHLKSDVKPFSEAQFRPQRGVFLGPRVGPTGERVQKPHERKLEVQRIRRSADGLVSALKPFQVVPLDHVGHPNHVRNDAQTKDAEGQEIEHAES